jgi:hypothetical protein
MALKGGSPMTTYDRTARKQLAAENLAFQSNRLQWRDAESEWLRAEDALRDFEERTARYPTELLNGLSETGERLRLWRDEDRERVIGLDQAYAAMWEATAREDGEGAQR